MKHSIALLLLLAAPLLARAHEPLINPEEGRTLLERVTPDGKAIPGASMNWQFYTSAGLYLTDGRLDEAAFKINQVRWEVLGTFAGNFSYHFRQSFNKTSNPYALDNLSSSIEYAFVRWDLLPRFALTAGKQIMQLGGYEYWVEAIKIREFSDFNNYLSCYQTGLTGTVTLSPTQQLNLQVLNSRNGSSSDAFLHGLPAGVQRAKVPLMATANWEGFFLPDRALNLRYSLSLGQAAQGRNLFYLTAGNVWKRGPLVAYVDLMYSREGLDSKGLVSDLTAAADEEGGVTAQHVSYLTTIANVDYRVHPQWNVYVKGAYETARVYRANGPYEAGLYRRTWNAQASVEFYPLKNSELFLFLHYLYRHRGLTQRARALGGEAISQQRVSLGLVYTIPVF